MSNEVYSQENGTKVVKENDHKGEDSFCSQSDKKSQESQGSGGSQESQASQLSHLSSADMFSSTQVPLPGTNVNATKEEKTRTANKRKKTEKKKGGESAAQGKPGSQS